VEDVVPSAPLPLSIGSFDPSPTIQASKSPHNIYQSSGVKEVQLVELRDEDKDQSQDIGDVVEPIEGQHRSALTNEGSDGEEEAPNERKLEGREFVRGPCVHCGVMVLSKFQVRKQIYSHIVATNRRCCWM
jgi:hypothetical protein